MSRQAAAEGSEAALAGVREVPHTAERAAFPLGGIGTGNVSLGARGELRDWELENRPDKGRFNPYSFFAIHTRGEGVDPVSRVLEAELVGAHDNDIGYPFDRLAGLPRLRSASMRAAYPVVDIDFQDDVLPVDVSLRALTPLVPLNVDDSGIPAAVIRYTVSNPTPRPITVTIAGSVSHTAGRGEGPFGMRGIQSVVWREEGDVRGLDFGIALPKEDPGYGTLSLTTTDAATTTKPRWVTGFWPDGPRLFWNDFAADGLLEPEDRLTLEDRPRGLFAETAREGEWTEEELEEVLPRVRTGSLGIVHDIAPGDEATYEFVLSWSFPLRARSWQGGIVADPEPDRTPVRNHYATLFEDAWAAGAYVHEQRDRLEGQTVAFAAALHGGALAPEIARAAGASIAAARSTTCFIVESPTPELGEGPLFAAWEGSFDHGGACEGTCTHVWAYAQTIAWLFPSLERSARRAEFLLETDEDGAQKFRGNRLWGAPSWFMGPAVDGQLGTFIRLYREWRFSGDDSFLRELWPAAARSLDYALREWDRDGDGLLDGELHNTYDIEFIGVDPLANTMLLTALHAGARLADVLGESERAAHWRSRAAALAAGIDTVLWNGEYYRQVVDDVDERRYQYGEGVLSDQLLGQFHAYLNGFGAVLDEGHVRSALGAIVRHNFRGDLSAHESTQRGYAVGHEGGLLLASWPSGERPAIPFVYSDEVWTGIEHQVAATLIYAGERRSADLIEDAVDARYNGVARNPWNEIEWGNHYARSLAAWGLVLALSGAQWDASAATLAFDPADDGDYPFTTKDGWGLAGVSSGEFRIRAVGGTVHASELILRGGVVARDITLAAGDELVVPDAAKKENS